MKNKNIIFIGTSEFAQIILSSLLKTKWQPGLVISQPDKPAGRQKKILPTPVAKLALDTKLALLQPEKIINLLKEINNFNPDLIIVAAYGQIIPMEVLNIPQFGSINIHASLLPKYRGSSPIQTAILNDDEYTGITLMLMDEKMDHGPIIAQEKIKISDADTFLSLQKKLAQLGAKLLIQTLPLWFDKKIKPQEQNHKLATYTKILSKDNGHIDWSNTAEQIERQIRALHPWPGTWTIWQISKTKSKILKILKAHVSKIDLNEHEFGQVFVGHEDEIVVRCGFDNLALDKVQLEGKKEMSVAEFARGHKNFVDAILK